MRKPVVALFCCVLLLSALIAPVALADNSGELVYVTNTGEKYHRDGCGYLRSKNEVTLRYAVEHAYTPCSRCAPPRPDFEYTLISQQRRESSGASGTSSSTRSGETEELAKTAEGRYIVFINSSGSTYHEAGCASLREASRISLRTATAQGYIPCSRCDPPELNDEEQQELEEEAEEEKGDPIWGWFFALLFVGGPLAFEGIASVYAWFAAAKDRRKEKEQYMLLYSGRTTEQLVAIPHGHRIGSDGLPQSDGIGRWGNVFTFYVSSSGKAYHERGCRYRGTIEANAYNLRYSGKAPCKVCKPTLPDMAWVDEYKRIKGIKEKYKIE